jgi:hypothetical protein
MQRALQDSGSRGNLRSCASGLMGPCCLALLWLLVACGSPAMPQALEDGRYEYRVRLLQAGPWLIWVRSFDDTGYLVAPDPGPASETILQVIQEHGLRESP